LTFCCFVLPVVSTPVRRSLPRASSSAGAGVVERPLAIARVFTNRHGFDPILGDS
jgi:hypothetical protein